MQAPDTQAPIPCQPQFMQEHCHTIGGGANIRCIVIPTPSNTASRQAHPIAEFLMDRAPPAQLALYYKSTMAWREGMYLSQQESHQSKIQRISHYNQHWPKISDAEWSVLPWIFFLSNAFHGTIVSTEQSTPNSKVPSQNWRTGFYRGNRPNEPLTLPLAHEQNQTPRIKEGTHMRRVSESLHTMPY